MNLLYLGDNVELPKTGYDVLNSRNLRILKYQYEDGVRICEFEPQNVRDRLSLYIGGTSNNYINKVLKEIKTDAPDVIFSCSSMLGPVLKRIKKKYPDIPIICNFHNVERHYASEFLRTAGVKHLPFYIGARIAEDLSVRYSDYLWVLNGRDDDLLERYYNRKADLIVPIATEDSKTDRYILRCVSKKNRPILELVFVGTAFFANIDGITWFCSEVMPHIEAHLTIIGKGMDQLKYLENKKITVKGFAPDLETEYAASHFVIAPIRVGGGMKTKIAEALMFGKTIVGTEEALTGYKIEEGSIIKCEKAEDFISFFNRCNVNDLEKFNTRSRKIFEDYYSFKAISNKMISFIEKTI